MQGGAQAPVTAVAARGTCGSCWADGQRQDSHRPDQVHNVCLLTAISYMIDMARFGLMGDVSCLRRYAKVS
jgi:hypothetical protein